MPARMAASLRASPALESPAPPAGDGFGGQPSSTAATALLVVVFANAHFPNQQQPTAGSGLLPGQSGPGQQGLQGLGAGHGGALGKVGGAVHHPAAHQAGNLLADQP